MRKIILALSRFIFSICSAEIIDQNIASPKPSLVFIYDNNMGKTGPNNSYVVIFEALPMNNVTSNVLLLPTMVFLLLSPTPIALPLFI